MKEKNKGITIHKKQAMIFLVATIILLLFIILILLITKQNAVNRFKKAIAATNYKVEISILNSKYAEVNGTKTKSPLWGGERDVEGKKKTRQELALLK